MKNKYFCKLLATVILTFGLVAHAFATDTCASTADIADDPSTTPPQYRLPAILIDGSSSGSLCTDLNIPVHLNNDDNGIDYDRPVKCIFPDASTKGNEQITGGYARCYSFLDGTNDTVSIPPDITCNTGTVTKETYSTKIVLADGDSCAMFFQPASGHTYSDIRYSATLSRSGDSYTVSAGSVCGSAHGACNPVNLSVSSSTGSEAAATAITVTATASAAVSGAQTVIVGVSGTGITAGDYTLSNTTLTIPNGATTGTVTFTIVDDAAVEGSETAAIAISSPSSGITLGSTTSQNVTITDNDSAPPLVINEIDYDNVSTDDAEFVEIKNISGSAINLSGYTLEFINDTNNSTYRSVSLPNVSLAASDYYVICGNNSTVANCDLDSVPDTDFIQNGTPDIARIIQGSFVIDTVSYDGTADPAIFVETTGTTATDSNTEAFVSLSRYADGTDTGNNNSDFKLKCMTPGVANSINDSSGCFVLSINDPSAVSEGNSGTTTLTFTVTLSHAAASNVTVNYATANDTATAGNDYTSASGTLTFAAGETSKTISVTVTGDQIDENNETFKVNLTSPSNNAQLSATVGATEGIGTITDDDTPGITVNPTTLTVSEPSGTANFAIKLNTQPSGSNDVTIPLSSSSACTISTSSVTIANANWSTGATITVTASDDNIINGSSRTCTITTNNSTSSDGSYNNVNPSDVTVTVTDNDTPGVTGIGGSVNATEGGSNGTYSLTLNSQPTGDVEITVTANAQTEVSKDGTTFGNTAVFTFTNANWNTAQTVTVKAIDDTTVEGSHTATITNAITGTVTDTNYPTTLTLGSVTINITDNDQTSSNSGGGSTSSGSVVLPSKMQMGVNISGTGSGRVVSQPSGIDCQKTSGTCQADFSANTQVTLTATADDNSEFGGFGGHTDCGDGSLLLLGNRQCTVFFKQKVVSPSIDDNDNGGNNNGNGNSNTSHKMISVYRLWSYTWKGHFYTTDSIEREQTLSHQQEWRDEDVAYYVYSEADHPDNTHPVYRFWSYVWQSHFYTMNESEMQHLVMQFTDQWRYEGIAYYAYVEGEQPVNSIPIYRFYSFVYQSHFYTINENERNVLLTHPTSEWRYEGIAWYVSAP